MSARQWAYLDHAATTPLDPRVLQAMLPYFNEDYGNPASVHGYGQRAEAAVEAARANLAAHLHCASHELVFTSGGTESNNLALRGAALAARQQRGARHLLVSPVEHDAVAKTARALAEQFDFELEWLPVDGFGRVDPADVARRLRPETALVSVILGNNEIGSLNPLAEIGAICRERGVPLHSDAVQAAAHLPIDVSGLQVDLLSISAHKFYGPKGTGVLYVRQGTPLLPQQIGGSHEEGRRAGTLNVPLIVGMAKALELTKNEMEEQGQRLRPLQDELIQGVLNAIPDAQLTGHPRERMANHASFVFEGVDGNALLMLLDDAGFACSSGSACKTANPEPSQVLLALGLTPQWALGSLRVTLGRESTPEQVQALLSVLPALVARARQLELA
ncbi:MAG: cysteine desulfurase [Anaerolineales bacterium]|nr:cysteine desulfurase [Anaerolineales bacterium]MCW5854951.1 cysteine desulfurase [Anaerolineales bacterium]